MDKLLWEQALDDLAEEAHGNGNDWDLVIAPRVTAIKEYFETIASLGRLPGKADEDRDNAIWNFEEQRRETARLRAALEYIRDHCNGTEANGVARKALAADSAPEANDGTAE